MIRQRISGHHMEQGKPPVPLAINLDWIVRSIGEGLWASWVVSIHTRWNSINNHLFQSPFMYPLAIEHSYRTITILIGPLSIASNHQRVVYRFPSKCACGFVLAILVPVFTGRTDSDIRYIEVGLETDPSQTTGYHTSKWVISWFIGSVSGKTHGYAMKCGGVNRNFSQRNQSIETVRPCQRQLKREQTSKAHGAGRLLQ